MDPNLNLGTQASIALWETTKHLDLNTVCIFGKSKHGPELCSLWFICTTNTHTPKHFPDRKGSQVYGKTSRKRILSEKQNYEMSAQIRVLYLTSTSEDKTA